MTDPVTLPILWPAMFLPQAVPARFADEFLFGLAGRADRLVADGENANALFGDLARSATAYASCRVPVHILCGSADIVTNPFAHGYAASWLIPGARFEWLHGLGHMLHHFRPDAVAVVVFRVSQAARTLVTDQDRTDPNQPAQFVRRPERAATDRNHRQI